MYTKNQTDDQHLFIDVSEHDFLLVFSLKQFYILSGVNLKMYHGTQIDHLSYNSGTIYFVCNKGDNGVKDETLTFEHVKTSLNQAHFKFFTHLAC